MFGKPIHSILILLKANACGRIRSMRVPSTVKFDFKEIRERNIMYIDKTMYIQRLVSDYRFNFFFISRPRRYGKSLTCSTLKYLFEGRRELFDGLYIATDTDYSFEEYPVIHLDFSLMSASSIDTFVRHFKRKISSQGVAYGIELEDDTPSAMLDLLLSRLDKEAVIIIDEFDSPIVSNLNNKELCEEIRQVLNDFYKVIKGNTGKIRFFFITGVTKLSNLSIFSAMNNLVDITMHPDYAGMLGFTEDEIEENLNENIEHYLSLPECEYKDRESFIKAMRDYYDGYRFSPRSMTKVYNPVSVSNFFESYYFDNYWNNTGVSTLVVELAKEYNLLDIVNERPSVSLLSFNTFDISFLVDKKLSSDNVLALLFYSGYLTIVGKVGESVILDFPNYEIRNSFLNSLLAYYTVDGGKTATYADFAFDAIEKGNVDSFIRYMNEYYGKFSYVDLGKDKERFVVTLFKAFFSNSRVARIDTEIPAGKGRADAILELERHIYIIEFKVDDTAENALEQIEDRKYYSKYQNEDNKDKTLHLLGISFSLEQSEISGYKEKTLN